MPRAGTTLTSYTTTLAAKPTAFGTGVTTVREGGLLWFLVEHQEHRDVQGHQAG